MRLPGSAPNLPVVLITRAANPSESFAAAEPSLGSPTSPKTPRHQKRTSLLRGSRIRTVPAHSLRCAGILLCDKYETLQSLLHSLASCRFSPVRSNLDIFHSNSEGVSESQRGGLMRPASTNSPANSRIMKSGQLLDLAQGFPAHRYRLLNFSEIVFHDTNLYIKIRIRVKLFVGEICCDGG